MAYQLLLLSAVRAMGGQAVLNGVMMRGEKSYAVAVRRMDDSIDVSIKDVPSFAKIFKDSFPPWSNGTRRIYGHRLSGTNAQRRPLP